MKKEYKIRELASEPSENDEDTMVKANNAFEAWNKYSSVMGEARRDHHYKVYDAQDLWEGEMTLVMEIICY